MIHVNVVQASWLVAFIVLVPGASVKQHEGFCPSTSHQDRVEDRPSLLQAVVQRSAVAKPASERAEEEKEEEEEEQEEEAAALVFEDIVRRGKSAHGTSPQQPPMQSPLPQELHTGALGRGHKRPHWAGPRQEHQDSSQAHRQKHRRELAAASLTAAARSRDDRGSHGVPPHRPPRQSPKPKGFHLISRGRSHTPPHRAGQQQERKDSAQARGRKHKRDPAASLVAAAKSLTLAARRLISSSHPEEPHATGHQPAPVEGTEVSGEHGGGLQPDNNSGGAEPAGTAEDVPEVSGGGLVPGNRGGGASEPVAASGAGRRTTRAAKSLRFELRLPFGLESIQTGKNGPVSAFLEQLRRELSVALGVSIGRVSVLGIRGKYMKLDLLAVSGKEVLLLDNGASSMGNITRIGAHSRSHPAGGHGHGQAGEQAVADQEAVDYVKDGPDGAEKTADGQAANPAMSVTRAQEPADRQATEQATTVTHKHYHYYSNDRGEVPPGKSFQGAIVDIELLPGKSFEEPTPSELLTDLRRQLSQADSALMRGGLGEELGVAALEDGRKSDDAEVAETDAKSRSPRALASATAAFAAFASLLLQQAV